MFKGKKIKLMNFLFCLLNFIFHQLLITYNSITISLIYKCLFSAFSSSLPTSMRFFKNASKK